MEFGHAGLFKQSYFLNSLCMRKNRAINVSVGYIDLVLWDIVERLMLILPMQGWCRMKDRTGLYCTAYTAYTA